MFAAYQKPTGSGAGPHASFVYQPGLQAGSAPTQLWPTASPPSHSITTQGPQLPIPPSPHMSPSTAGLQATAERMNPQQYWKLGQQSPAADFNIYQPGSTAARLFYQEPRCHRAEPGASACVSPPIESEIKAVRLPWAGGAGEGQPPPNSTHSPVLLPAPHHPTGHSHCKPAGKQKGNQVTFT